MKWSLTIYALIGLSSSTLCDALPTGGHAATESFPESRSPESDSPSSYSSSSARTLPAHEVGLPSELAWQAWLVVANKPDAQSSFESATVPRRIGPKSVFVAPRLETTRSCSDGYKADGSGGCETDTIKINPQDHWNFVIERINAMYPKISLDDSAATGSELKNSALSGPLQVNISLGIEDNSPPSWSEKPEGFEDSEDSEDDTVEISVVQVPPRKAALASEAVVALYEVENSTKIQGEEKGGTSFFPGNISEHQEEDHAVGEIAAPLDQILDNKNHTFAEVIDYEIPFTLEQLLNASRRGAAAESEPSAKNITEAEPTEDSRLPTVVLLLSPSKPETEAPASLSKDQNTSSEHIVEMKKNLTANSTEEETTTPVNVRGKYSPSDDTDDDEEEDGLTAADYGLEETTLYEITETISTTGYPEDLDDATEWNDEILARSEPGMVVSKDNFELSSSTNDTMVEPMVPTSEKVFDKTIDEEEISKITSESSIRGDVIVETTLLDLNTGVTSRNEKLNDYREVFEADKEIDLEPEVVFSPQDRHRLDQTNTRNAKRAENSGAKSSSSEKRESNPFLVGSESTVDKDDVFTAQSSPRESFQRYVSSRRNEPKEKPTKRRIYSNEDYVKFPEELRQPSASPGYVIFPSRNSNSITTTGGNLSNKESSPHIGGAAAQQVVVSNTNAPYNQRNTHWRLPPGWRIDDLQPPPPPQPVTAHNIGQRQNPMLLRFWTRMPLFRDPSLASSSGVLPIVNHRGSIYRQISSQSGNQKVSHKTALRVSNPLEQRYG